ncbi:MAG: alcohol dehydrogenase catalytic domain-containing protein [Proteobacteria bacterium]|nr:alcohol dehydrogenase catalytic domain-containing protein [Pseudomonadota bacterium]
MLAVIKEKVGKGWELREIPKPTISDRDVLIKVKMIGICGSDMAVYDGREKEITIPVVPGHEFAGEVVDRGSRVTGIPPRSRVAVNLVRNCGHCPYCRKGETNLCTNTNLIGFHTNGGFAEYAAVPGANCHLLPKKMSWEEAASVDPVASALAALRKTEINSSDRIGIIGPGPIGLYACQIAKAEGAKCAFVIGTREDRLAMASKLGADKTYLVDREDPLACGEVVTIDIGDGADFVLEASGNPKALNLAFQIAAKGARVALVSIYHEGSQVDPMTIVSKELKVYGSFDYKWIDFEDAIDLIARGRIRTKPLITHKFPLKDIQKGIRLMEERKAIKVMIEP